MKKYKSGKIFNSATVVALLLVVNSTPAQVLEKQTRESVFSSGQFTIEKSVIAGGGREKQHPPVSENGTTGQVVAGHRSNGGNFKLYSGFWTPNDFVPTAANVLVGGRVKTADGRGIRNVSVSITFPNGEIRNAKSSTFGYYQFSEIPAGGVYVISVHAKRYSFSQPTLAREISDDVTDIDFVAVELNSITGKTQP